MSWWLDVPEDAPHGIKQTPALYQVKTQATWPFELFDFDGWMLLDEPERRFFENAIAGAIQRARKTAATTLPALQSTL